jgi:hypothetical protein
MVDQWDLEDETRRIGSRPRTVGEYFAIKQPMLKPVPDEPFETGVVLSPRVDKLQSDRRAHQPLLGAGAADRPHGPGHAARLRNCWACCVRGTDTGQQMITVGPGLPTRSHAS